MKEAIHKSDRFAREVLPYASAAAVIVALSWPVVLSFDLWVFEDRGSLLNADVLLDEHLRLGVDTFYGYGLLPILIQHLVFHAFGRGAWPMIWMTFLYLSTLAAFCAFFRRRLPDDRIWTVALVALSPIVFWVNPTFPYCIVLLSMLFALVFVLGGRYDVAFAISMIGCVSVPSIPIVLALLLATLIVVDWYGQPQRDLRGLARSLLPGVTTYLVLVALLTICFGWRSTAATLTPLSALGHYHAVHYDNVLAYLQIGLHALPWYFYNRPAWWIFGTLVLLCAAARSASLAFERRRLERVEAFLIVSACAHFVFFTFAYGTPGQHVIYDPLLVAGVLVALAHFSFGNATRYALVTFVVLGIASDAVQIKQTVTAWKTTSVAPTTAGLYADRGWLRDWNDMLAAYAGLKILVLSYGTAPHVYFPQISSPDLWNLDIGQLTADDRRRLLAQVAAAQVVVEDLTGTPRFVDGDPDIQEHLRTMCLVSISKNMQIWRRREGNASHPSCLQNPRTQSRLARHGGWSFAPIGGLVQLQPPKRLVEN